MLQLVRYLVRDDDGDRFEYLLSQVGGEAEPIDADTGAALVTLGRFREVFTAPGGVLTRYELADTHDTKNQLLASPLRRGARQQRQRSRGLPGVRHLS